MSTDTGTSVEDGTVDHRPGDIDRLLGEAVAAMPAIGKDRTNNEQHFMFRGYDDIMAAVSTVFGSRGLYLMPHVLEFRTSSRQTRSGSHMWITHAHVAYTIRAADGSYVRGSCIGEGADVGDKATSKAMTMALKSFLVQALAITDKQTGDPDSSSAAASDPERFTCPACAEDGVETVTDEQQKMRDHLVAEHGWLRQSDGRVTRPRAEPPAETATAAPSAPQDRPAAPATAEPAPAAQPPAGPAPAATPDDAKNPGITPDVIAGMSKKELVPHLTANGLATSGTVAAMRERLINHLSQGTLGADPTPEPSITSAATAEPETSGDTPGGDPGEGWQCPDCNQFPFATEQEYEDHWMSAHGSDDDESDASAEDPDATDTATPAAEPAGDDMDTTPSHPDTIAEIKSMVSQLSGEKARAYAKYRREAALPKPDDLSMRQGVDLLEFLEKLLAG